MPRGLGTWKPDLLFQEFPQDTFIHTEQSQKRTPRSGVTVTCTVFAITIYPIICRIFTRQILVELRRGRLTTDTGTGSPLTELPLVIFVFGDELILHSKQRRLLGKWMRDRFPRTGLPEEVAWVWCPLPAACPVWS